MNTDFSGLSVALATPFAKNGAIDTAAFEKLCHHVASGGARTLVVLGSTGEAATIRHEEREVLIRSAIQVADRVAGTQVIVGTGSNATHQTVQWTREARDLGAHGALVVTPYYNKPMPAGILAHFKVIAEAVPEFPLMAYNVPSRTGTNMTPATLQELWKIPEVVALKESSGNLAQIGEIARTLPAGKQLLSGDDYAALATIALGGVGLVSVLGNALPRETTELVNAALQSDRQSAMEWQQRLIPIMDAMFVESNPIPLKAALQILGLGEAHLRLPLTSPTARTREVVTLALKELR